MFRRSIGLLLVLAAVLAAANAIPAKPKPRLWSLEPVVRPDVPAGATSSANPVDAFIAAKLREKGLRPNGPADKLVLLRRVYFDLIGLPPTSAEQDEFLADTSPDAYEKVVDRLLNSEQHGVRWARQWLDVLRYADLDGLDGSVMPAAPGIYHWRDWVIAALNSDMPYDQFVRAQILGNRYRQHTTISGTGRRSRGEANPQDQFALGFLARAALTPNHKDQDISIAAVETVSSAFMGMTVACAKCHDHKFDPIKQTDFYAMKALFDPLVLRKVSLATAAEIDANGQAVEAYRREKEPIEDAIEKLAGPYEKKLYDERVALLTPEIQAVIRKPERKRTPAEQKIADDYSPVLRIDPPKIKEIMSPEEIAKYDALLERQHALTKPPELPSHWIVEEDSALLKEKTYVLTSGDPSKPEKDKPVEPGFPFQPEDVDFRDGRREGFVDWLTSPDNPLFARVAVNRIWQWHFGEGLQKTASDFGVLGGRPSNQKLLDYLAAEFVSHDYSMKWLHRLLVTSDTYKMASQADPRYLAANQKIDPANSYVWHFRLKRLEAEPLWDSILFSAGELNLAVGGKSFQLVQADSKQSIFLPRDGTFETQSTRRGIYIARGFIPSTDVMSNFLQTFDVDDGRTPCPLRAQTITAPQALFSMNDELIEKSTERLAERVLNESSGDVRGAAERMFRETLGRPASGTELDRALSYVENDPGKLKGLAWLLFNLDEFIFVK
jgi:hypothetical protein